MKHGGRKSTGLVCQFASFVVETEPSNMRKRGNPFAGRVKTRKKIAIQFTTFESSQERKGKTPAGGGQKWKEHFNRWITGHKEKGQLYFEFEPGNVIEKTWLVDGREATPDQVETIKSFIPEYDGPPEWGMVKIDNIKEARFGGEVYKVN